MAHSIETMFGMKDKVIVVTGGTRGIGRTITEALCELGAKVIAFGSTERSVSAAREAMPDCDFMVVNVGDDNAVRNAAEAVFAKYGRVDGLVTIAGTQELQAALEATQESFNHVMNINVTGTMLCAKYFGAIMKDQGKGRIVTCGSVRGSQGKANYASYAASKGAVKNLTRSLAVEFAPYGVTVNCFSPCFVLTELATDMMTEAGYNWAVSRIPMGRLGEPQDMVGTVVFLLSDASAFVTGADIPVDGGWMAG